LLPVCCNLNCCSHYVFLFSIVSRFLSSWLSACCSYLLTQHPEAEQAVLQELQAAGLPCKGDLAAVQAALSMESLRQLPFTTAVLHEAMRLFPAGVAATPR
jgi:cytochrome P450